MKIALTATDQPKAQEAHAELSKRYDIVDAIYADIIIALGGDGLMLQCGMQVQLYEQGIVTGMVPVLLLSEDCIQRTSASLFMCPTLRLQARKHMDNVGCVDLIFSGQGISHVEY